MIWMQDIIAYLWQTTEYMKSKEEHYASQLPQDPKLHCRTEQKVRRFICVPVPLSGGNAYLCCNNDSNI
jgi:hypothetical protein